MWNWQTIAEQELRDYPLLVAAAENLRLQIAAINEEMVSLRGAKTDGVPVKGGTSTYEDRILNAITKKDKLWHRLRRTAAEIKAIDRALDVIGAEDRAVLNWAFRAEKGGCQRVMRELNIERAEAYRRRDKAIRAFAIAMYGKEE